MRELAEMRISAGLTVRQLALRAETSHSTIVAYEQGRKIPRADTRDRLVRAAGWACDLHTGERQGGLTASGQDPTAELIDVLGIVEVMPQEHRRQLDAPTLPQRLP